MAETEDVHRSAFNAAFIKLDLWWDWGPLVYSELLEVSGGIARLHRYIERLKESAAEKKRLHAIVPVIHYTKSQICRELLRTWRPPLRPGVKRLIGEARDQGLKVAVVSTSATANAREVLDNHFRGEIDVLVCVDEVERGKPAPDVYRRAAALLRKPAQACVAFEDSANGLRAARAAGLATVVTPSRWTMAQDFRGADRLRPDLADQHLEEIRRIHQCKRPSLSS
jgi:HAD superfamily hydrolase (TIGR01509 family)